MKIIISIIFLFASVQISLAGDGKLEIVGAWVRPVIIQNRPGVAYFMINNDTDREEKLIEASSSLTTRIEFHRSKHVGDVITMLPVTDIPVGAHGVTAVAPGGYHLMLFGLKKKLVTGDEFPLTLTFDPGGKISVMAKVTARAP